MKGTTLNPFIWTGPVEDGLSRQPFTERVALALKAGTHVALFAPRGTGKTSFLHELGVELGTEHGPDAPPWDLVTIDLRRAISQSAFIGAISDAVDKHPNRNLRRKGIAAFNRLEKEMKINLGVVKAGVRSAAQRDLNESEILHRQLLALSELSEHLVVAFDEFQRLNSCPGEPLSIIRSALMGTEQTGRLALLLTGSMRERLELMLHTDTEPIWNQTLDQELPPLDSADFADYLQDRFEATGKPIEDRAVEHLIELTKSHPKSTQHLAWHVWDRSTGENDISVEDVQEAFEDLLDSGSSSTGFAREFEMLLSGNESEINDARALLLVASNASPGSSAAARQYGLSNATATRRALDRLHDRGLIGDDGGTWVVVDPLLAEWLRRNNPTQNS